jgi:hypothetical protein
MRQFRESGIYRTLPASRVALIWRERIRPCAHFDRPAATFIDDQDGRAFRKRFTRPGNERLGSPANLDKNLAWAPVAAGRDDDLADAADSRDIRNHEAPQRVRDLSTQTSPAERCSGPRNTSRCARVLTRVGVMCPPGLTHCLRGLPFGWSRVAPFAERRPHTGPRGVDETQP